MFPRETTLSTWVCPDDLETVLQTRYALNFMPGAEIHMSPVTNVLEKLKLLSHSLGDFALGTESLVDNKVKYVQMLSFLQTICEKGLEVWSFYKRCQSHFSTANDDIKVEIFSNTDWETLFLISPLSGQSDVSWLLVVPDLLMAMEIVKQDWEDRKSTRLNSSHSGESRMPSSA